MASKHNQAEIDAAKKRIGEVMVHLRIQANMAIVSGLTPKVAIAGYGPNGTGQMFGSMAIEFLEDVAIIAGADDWFEGTSEKAGADHECG